MLNPFPHGINKTADISRRRGRLHNILYGDGRGRRSGKSIKGIIVEIVQLGYVRPKHGDGNGYLVNDQYAVSTINDIHLVKGFFTVLKQVVYIDFRQCPFGEGG